MHLMYSQWLVNRFASCAQLVCCRKMVWLSAVSSILIDNVLQQCPPVFTVDSQTISPMQQDIWCMLKDTQAFIIVNKVQKSQQ